MDDGAISLDVLGLRFETDKASSHHNYLTFYEHFFERLRHKELKILEVGVAGGGSLNVWKEYFQKSSIVGADINALAAQFAGPRVEIVIIDQSDLEDLVHLGVDHGPFDIIIEDGSHHWEHQITTLRTLFPFLRKGGIYIIEDLQTNFGSLANEYRGISSISCIDYLKRWVDIWVAGYQVDIKREEDAFLRTYGRTVDFITFYRGACLIKKSLEKGSSTLPNMPFVPTDGDTSVVPLSLGAHVGFQGDTWGESGCVRSLHNSANIQGFSIHVQGELASGLMYRARRSSGVWTEWGLCGSFAGTRGQSDDLSGFSVRLVGKAAADFKVEAIGAFRDEVENIVVHDGEECVPRNGQSALCGMQVIIRAKQPSLSHR